jgi:hypothetical protein
VIVSRDRGQASSAHEFPDWNSWLPPVHPLDLWAPGAGETTGLFETGYDSGNPLAIYQAIEAWLEKNKNPNGVYGDWSHLTASERNDLQGQLQNFGSQTTNFGGGSRGTRVSPDANNPFGVQIAAQKLQALLSSATASLADLTTCGPTGPCTPFSTEAFIERADVGLYHWLGVKQWELVETYGLQDQRAFHGTVRRPTLLHRRGPHVATERFERQALLPVSRQRRLHDRAI